MYNPRLLPGQTAFTATLFAALILCTSASAQTTPDAIPAPTPAAQAPGFPPGQKTQSPFKSMPAYAPYTENVVSKDALGSTYIPVDSHIYPMAMRLYSMGYLDTAFISMRPWTRRSLTHMLELALPKMEADGNEEALDILYRIHEDYLDNEWTSETNSRDNVTGLDTVYTRLMGIAGPALRDSFHLGQTIANDYGRPYAPGFNNVTGFSSINEVGRFSLYVRGEYQRAPATTGYSAYVANQLDIPDEIDPTVYPVSKQATLPYGHIAAQNPFRLQEATLSYHLLGHEISGGKTDSWIGPGAGGGMAYSNNAENIYSFRINRVEPLYIPYLSRVLGPMRYDFFVGSLKGHIDPNDPWIHSETISLAPTSNFQFTFQRSVIWGGHGHEPITLHTFLQSFFSFDDVNGQVKGSAKDPGARYSAFSFSWRLPYLSHHVTLYTDSIAHDDISPPTAPRRAAYRPGVYISQFPGAKNLDLRVEGVSTDTSTLRSVNGTFNYWESIQRQGYTNKGYIMGDWIGREAKGGQAWLTYHLSPNEFLQVEYLYKKTPKDFIPGGTTQNQFKAEFVKRLGRDLELDAWVQVERWKAPIYYTSAPGGAPNTNTIAVLQFTYYPKLRAGSRGGLLGY